MAKQWYDVLSRNSQKWKIPNEVETGLEGLTEDAQEAYNETQSASRGPVATTRAHSAFNKLTAYMRDAKDRHFKIPPLTDADFTSLGLRLRDNIKTPVPAPTSQPEGIIVYPGVGLVRITKIQMAGGKLDRRSDYGVRIYYGVLAAPAAHDKFRLSAPPKTGDDLPHSVFTRKKSHLFDFAGDSGNAVYFCMRYENSKGEAGPWGPVMETHIP
jgi:hypothetical protein